MKLLVSLYDKKTEAYAPVMTVNSWGEATRSMKQAMQDQNSMLHQFPEDYDLYELGKYNDQTGEIIISHPPVLIVRAETIKPTQE